MRSILLAVQLVLVAPCLSGLAARAHADAFPPPYRFQVQPLGSLAGLDNYDATAINNLGHVIGNATGSDGRLRTFLYDGSGMREIEALSAINARVAGINSAGQLVGTANDQAFLYAGNTIIFPAQGQAVRSSASAINEAGRATGWAVWESGGARQAALFSNGQATDLTQLDNGNDSMGHAINARGDVAAEHFAPGPADYRPVVYYADGTAGYPSLGSSLFTHGTALDINDVGEAVGWQNADGDYDYAFLYVDGVTHALYPRINWGSRAYGINNRGQVVGSLGIWETNGVLYSLADLMPSDSPWQVTQWDLINDSGQIAATACKAGACQLVLLTPVPEPATFAMLLAGLAAGRSFIRRRHRRAIDCGVPC